MYSRRNKKSRLRNTICRLKFGKNFREIRISRFMSSGWRMNTRGFVWGVPLRPVRVSESVSVELERQQVAATVHDVNVATAIEQHT